MNTVNTKAVIKELTKLSGKIQKVATEAIRNITLNTTSENAFNMSFDELEAVPFGTSGSKITVVTDNMDPVELEVKMQELSRNSLDALDKAIKDGMKGVLK